jgi:PAS domain S-box-containing protein
MRTRSVCGDEREVDVVSAGEQRASILVVDDQPHNLVALHAILEPLGHRLVCVESGEAALRELTHADFACILLDVQMPELDGFATAELIKQRERTRDVPIVFLTAISKGEQHVFRGESSGVVDYLFKPFGAEVVRAKVAVFAELWEKTRQLERQGELLRGRELQALRLVSEERYRQLADAMPQIVWTSDTGGGVTYFNHRWFEYTGMTREENGPTTWQLIVHPDDRPQVLERRRETLVTGEVFETEYRLRSATGDYRWHLGRAVPIRDDDGAIAFWVGTATDIHDRKRDEEERRFVAEATDILASSLDYETTLARVAEAAVPVIADWCAVDVVEDDGSIRRLALAHEDPQKVRFARELQERYPPRADAAQGPAAVIRAGEPELVPEIAVEQLAAGAHDEIHLGLVSQLGLRSYMCVPLVARGRILGAMTLVAAESDRSFEAVDLALAKEVARRAATAIDNARLYREAEQRAQAARVLATIGDGVVLVDGDQRVRLWNAAAQTVTGLDEREVVGRPAADVIPSWPEIESRVRVARAGERQIPESLPVELPGRELWLSISAVGFEDGTIYAFRDLTADRALEELRQDLVATVSHELRTPLAAIYGAALTLRREDLHLTLDLREKLLTVIADESEQLSSIVDELLLASQLDSGKLQVNIEHCDPRTLAESVVRAARARLPQRLAIEFDAEETLPEVEADAEQLRQVLTNLVDNAIKYSPQGGRVEVRLEAYEAQLRFAISDQGLGIPSSEQRRIFEKFYRVDPQMARGIGGTGLGLYISRELVRRVNGRIWVESRVGEGSTFFVEIPLARGRQRIGEPAVVA